MAQFVMINIMGNEHHTQVIQGLLNISVEIKNKAEIISKSLECNGIQERNPQLCYGTLDGLGQLY